MPVLAKPQVSKSTRLLDQLREQIRYLHYSLRTEEVYVYWVKNFIRFHDLEHPRGMGQAEIEAFLTYLATQRKVLRLERAGLPTLEEMTARFADLDEGDDVP